MVIVVFGPAQSVLNLAAIFNYIDKLFHAIKPTKLFMLAVDGPAPRAKMNQQVRLLMFGEANRCSCLPCDSAVAASSQPTTPSSTRRRPLLRAKRFRKSQPLIGNVVKSRKNLTFKVFLNLLCLADSVQSTDSLGLKQYHHARNRLYGPAHETSQGDCLCSSGIVSYSPKTFLRVDACQHIFASGSWQRAFPSIAKWFLRKKIKEDSSWRGIDVIFSGQEVPGEGEHKIMQYIRMAKVDVVARVSGGIADGSLFAQCAPDYNPNLTHCIYGLDADLMMLGLSTHEPNFCLLREEVLLKVRRRWTLTNSIQLQSAQMQCALQSPVF
jgi:hypothetical protein